MAVTRMTNYHEDPREDGRPDPLISRELEEGLIGLLIFYGNDLVDEINERLPRGAYTFVSRQCRDVYTALLSMHARGHSIDTDSLIAHLRMTGGVKTDANEDWLRALDDGIHRDPQYARDWADDLAEMAWRRYVRDDVAADLKHATEHKTREELDNLIMSHVDALSLGAGAGAADELQVLTLDEAIALPPLVGILGNLLFDESVCYLYAQSGRWKSFTALDWGLCIATGRPWMGKPTQQGAVVYVCSEGARGMGKRAQAWKMRNGVRGFIPFYIIPMSVDLTNMAQMGALQRKIDALNITPALIVFDTLAASNSGDENDASNARAIDNAARRLIRRYAPASVLIIHHAGYDASHMRGSSAFGANADIVIQMKGGTPNERITPGEPVTLVSVKPKEGEAFDDITLTADLQTWADESGVTHGSLVMIPCDKPAAAAAALTAQQRRKQANEDAALAALEDADPQDGKGANDWKRASGLPHTTFFDTRKALIGAGKVEALLNGNYRLVSTGSTE